MSKCLRTTPLTREEQDALKERLKDRRDASLEDHLNEVPSKLRWDELPEGEPDKIRTWCTNCGLPDPPEGPPSYYQGREKKLPCPRCGSRWRWSGRVCDADGSATEPPQDVECLKCYEWRPYPQGQKHFGWSFWLTHRLARCPYSCEHHATEMWEG